MFLLTQVFRVAALVSAFVVFKDSTEKVLNQLVPRSNTFSVTTPRPQIIPIRTTIFRSTTVSSTTPGAISSTTPAQTQSTQANLNVLECGRAASESDGNDDDSVSPLTRIVNGVNARRNEIPWRCYIVIPTKNGFCGCSIIDNSWILTAAHCTKNTTAKEIIVVAGSWNIGMRENQSVLGTVDRVVQHRNFNPRTWNNDITLLHLKKPLKWTKSIRPVCLPWRSEGNNCETEFTYVMASGWGTTSYNGEPASILQKVELPCLSTERCRQFYTGRITDNMICTYSPQGKDACQGDSGGSIDYKDEESGRYYAIGIVSWGIRCAQLNRPGAFTKVTNYLSWIRRAIKTQ